MARGRLPSGANLALFETLDSTSLEAKRRAADGARGPIWILAVEQTAGYGRRGSTWQQAPGDIATTLLFYPDAPAETIGELSFVAGLAVRDAIARYAPNAALTLKWPNDVLVDGAKIAGLLLELIDAGAGRLIAVGVGVNVVSKPAVADYPTARLIDIMDGAPPQPAEFVQALDAAFFEWIGAWRRDGFPAIRKAWLEAAAGRGERLRVRLPDDEIEGVFVDLDPTGALVLEYEGERRLIRAGAVIRT